MDRRGLHCPCGAPLDTRMVAESYPIEGGGQRRIRVCDSCGGRAASIEWVVGVKAGPMILVTGLEDKRSRGSRHGPTPKVSAIFELAKALGGRAVRL